MLRRNIAIAIVRKVIHPYPIVDNGPMERKPLPRHPVTCKYQGKTHNGMHLYNCGVDLPLYADKSHPKLLLQIYTTASVGVIQRGA